MISSRHLITLGCICLLFAETKAAEKFTVRPVGQIYDVEGAGQLSQPEGVACDDRHVVVADTGNGRLIRFSLEGGRLTAPQVIKAPGLTSPSRVHLAPDGRILALDNRAHQVLLFTASGELQGPLKLSGIPNERSAWISSFTLDSDGRVALLDAATSRVLLVNANGTFQEAIPLPDTGGMFTDLAIDGKGTLFALDTVGGRIHAASRDRRTFSPLGESLSEIASFPTHMTADPNGFLLLTDRHGGGILRLDRNGNFRGRALSLGWKAGQLYYPSQTAATTSGMLFVADTGNSRVQVFQLTTASP